MVQPELTEDEFNKNVTPIVQVRPAEKVFTESVCDLAVQQSKQES